MNFKTFWLGMTQDERKAFADGLGKSAGYLQLVSGGFRRASHGLAIQIEEKSGGAVTRQDMRPDIFGAPPQREAEDGDRAA